MKGRVTEMEGRTDRRERERRERERERDSIGCFISQIFTMAKVESSQNQKLREPSMSPTLVAEAQVLKPSSQKH